MKGDQYKIHTNSNSTNCSTRKNAPDENIKNNKKILHTSRNRCTSVDHEIKTEKSQLSNIYSNTQTSCNVPNAKIDSMLKRFKEHEARTKNKIENMKLMLEEEVLSNYRKIPHVNKSPFKSEKVNFLKRVEINKNELEKKKKLLEEQYLLEKKKEDEELKNPKLNAKKNEKLVQKKISEIFKWEDMRKERLKAKKEIDDAEFKQLHTFRPDINKKRPLSQVPIKMNEKVKPLKNISRKDKTLTKTYSDLSNNQSEVKQLKNNLMKIPKNNKDQLNISQLNDDKIIKQNTNKKCTKDFSKFIDSVSDKEYLIIKDLLHRRFFQDK
jgi:hypothetical protein